MDNQGETDYNTSRSRLITGIERKMSKSKLPQYRAHLDSTQIADGMKAARRNARRLVDDAKLLLDAGRYSTAAALAVFSIEEIGKEMILRDFASAPETANPKNMWKKYRSHRDKNWVWILPYPFTNGVFDWDKFRDVVDIVTNDPGLVDRYRESSLYTDYLGAGYWSEPEKVVDVELASFLVEIADQLAHESTTTTKEFELRKEHLGPVYDGTPEEKLKALLNFIAALLDEGLLNDVNLSEVANRLGGRRPRTVVDS